MDYVKGVPVNPERKTATGRALLEGRTIHIPDVLMDPDYAFGDAQRLGDFRTILGIPMFIESSAVGVLALTRSEVRPFSKEEIEAVSTFADQAAIAIDNASLFGQLRRPTNELAESLEQQTATSDVLNAISQSIFDLQPVLDIIVRTASRLCDAEFALIFKLENGHFRLAAANNATAKFVQHALENPIQPGRGSLIGRTVLERSIVHIPDCLVDPEYTFVEYQQSGRYRAMLGVPLIRDGVVIGVIGLLRTAVKSFTDKQMKLVSTFADQAVVAIENARLFDEVQARTHELTEALEQQTATSEVLKVISRSTFDLQTVLDTLVDSATHLCDAESAHIFRWNGKAYQLAACRGYSREYEQFMSTREFPPARDSLVGRIASERQIVHIHDVLVDSEYHQPEAQLLGRFRTMLGVPLLREGSPIGALTVTRSVVRPFTDRQIELLKTFADQAVIAIENTRLLNELRESLERQTATSEVLKVISSSRGNLDPVFGAIIANAFRLCEAKIGGLWLAEGDGYRIAAHKGFSSTSFDKYMERNPILHPSPESPLSVVARTKQLLQIPDMREHPDYVNGFAPIVALVEIAGARTLLEIPLLKDNVVIGAFGIFRQQVQLFDEKQIELLQNFAEQAVIAIENARLLHELQDKSHRLEIASQHKSQFLANMSHELRTPLNAILGYTELILDSIYGEPTEKMRAVLERLQANGKHLLNLINDVLDLSKIEAGQLTLDLEATRSTTWSTP